ncbi:MAG: hypothetical protein IKX40_01935 [Thermoguttaceae bacterium]|nr:hypothetical protein [Thermoguttaceae bacterium]
MLKYTELIQQIECLMDDPSAVPMEKIAELATAYSEACEWVNENVVLCVNTLRQGNASEALRLSRELDLLENYKTLVFDDYDAWISAALTFGDVAIPAFNRRLIDELDAAQVCMRPVEEILKSHRILALTHAPLSVRVPILRKLVELDPKNTGWKNELRDYETARLELIYEELSHPLSYNDCVRILKEIEGAKWSVEIPLKIKKKIAVIRQEYQQKNRQKQIDQYNAKLNEIADKLLESYNVYDFEGAKRWRTSWFKALDEFQNLQLIPPYDLIHSVDEALQWIDNEQKGRDLLQEYNSKVAEVDREMKRSISIDKCQRLILDLTRAADAIGQQVPERFQNHLDKLIANEERKESRRGRFATGIFTIILLAVIGGVSFGVYEFVQWYRFNLLLDNLAKYEQAVSEDKNILTEAYQFVRNLESSGYQLAAYPDVQKSIAHIKKLYEEDKLRHEDWKLLHDKIDRAIKRGEAASSEEMKDLEKLTELKEEKEAYAVLEKANTALLDESNDAFVKQQNEKLNEIQQTAQELLNTDEIADVVKLREIESQVLQIKQSFADYAFGKPSLEKAARIFESKCSSLLVSIKTVIDKSNSDSMLSIDLDNLASNMESESDYVQGLQLILDKNSDSSYTQDFQSVIKERNVWGQAYAWNKFISQNNSFYRGTNRSAIQLKDFLTQWKSMTFKPSELSTVKKIDGRLPYYQSIADCSPSASLRPLKDLCYLYYRLEFWYYEASLKPQDAQDSQNSKEPQDAQIYRYYFNMKPIVNRGRQSVNYMETVSDVSDNKVVLEQSARIVALNNRSFSKKISGLMGMINENYKYTECGIQILDAIYQDTTVQDPIIKYQFMTTALDCLVNSDIIIQENFGDLLQDLDNEDLKQCNPFDPEEASAHRAEAERALERLKDFSKRVKTAQTRNEQLTQPFSVETLKPVGWLDKSSSQWTVKGVSANVDGELYVVTNNGLSSAGTVKNKEVKMRSLPDGKRGLPVFMIKTIKP